MKYITGISIGIGGKSTMEGMMMKKPEYRIRNAQRNPQRYAGRGAQEVSPDFTEETARELLQELEGYRESGCGIYLNGKPSASQRIVEACLRERSCYMRDFVSDDQRRIRKVDFIQVNESE